MRLSSIILDFIALFVNDCGLSSHYHRSVVSIHQFAPAVLVDILVLLRLPQFVPRREDLRLLAHLPHLLALCRDTPRRESVSLAVNPAHRTDDHLVGVGRQRCRRVSRFQTLAPVLPGLSRHHPRPCRPPPRLWGGVWYREAMLQLGALSSAISLFG